ncbi:MAG: MarR family transcriptional regulator [Gaiellales bacterium]
MSKHKQRPELLERIHNACRAFRNGADQFDEVVCACVDINRTDLRCLDILERLGPLTAGELAAEAGLTTGATTTLIDRLERAGYARRTRDARDRRKVVVELTETVLAHAETFYGEMSERWDALARSFTNAELETIALFLEHAREINTAGADRLRRELLEKPPSAA